MNRGPRSGRFGNACNYCHDTGDWKAECSVLKNKVLPTGTKYVNQCTS